MNDGRKECVGKQKGDWDKGKHTKRRQKQTWRGRKTEEKPLPKKLT